MALTEEMKLHSKLEVSMCVMEHMSNLPRAFFIAFMRSNELFHS
jgi:hypothetical protein